MSQIHKHSIPANIAERCLINPEQYEAQYQQSVTDPDAFWGEQGKILDWIKPYTRVKNTSFAPGNISIKWYEDGTLNLAANCLDRHLAEQGDQTAIIWEGDDASQSKNITYRELHRDVCRFANVLLDLGIKKGDVVAIYMPMVPEAAVAMLACARIGAIHSVIFGGFSPEAVAGRIIDSNSRLVITSDEGLRAGRAIPLKKNVDDNDSAVDAQMLRGLIDANGVVIPADDEQATWYFKRSSAISRTGYSEYWAGMMFLNGEQGFIVKNKQKALHWLNLSCTEGFDTGCEEFDKLTNG